MIKGSCFCGCIQYQIHGNVLKSGVCHCKDCQRLTGGVAWPFIVVPQEVLVIQGEIKEFSRSGASGKQVHMGFCGTCGSTLLGRPEIWPHIRTISVSSLDDPSFFLPSMHLWTKDAPEWFLFEPTVPKFDRNST